jgi:hypothetical protein
MLSAASASALDNAGIIKLKKADLADDTILLAIKKESANYDTSAEGLAALKEAGISEPVIREILARTSGTATDATAAPSSPAPEDNELFTVQSPSIAPPLIDPVVGKDYFTRYSFHYEGHDYPITNYARGPLLPINTAVKFVKMSGKKITLKRLDNNEEINVQNIPEYSGSKELGPVARLLLSAEPTPIEKLVPTLATAIRTGEMRRGMTKEQVLMTRGYPPAHETPSTDGDRWVYWSSRFVKQTIVFSQGRLTEGRQIR